MQSTVNDIMSKGVTAVPMTLEVEKIEKIMCDHEIHCLPVIDNDGKCFGVISCSDLVYWRSRNINFCGMTAWEICTNPVIQINPSVTVDEAAEYMLASGVHHLIVTINEGVVGIISSMDIIKNNLEKLK